MSEVSIFQELMEIASANVGLFFAIAFYWDMRKVIAGLSDLVKQNGELMRKVCDNLDDIAAKKSV